MHGVTIYVILLTTVTATMLEVYLLQRCNVVDVRVCCYVRNSMLVEKHNQ